MRLGEAIQGESLILPLEGGLSVNGRCTVAGLAVEGERFSRSTRKTRMAHPATSDDEEDDDAFLLAKSCFDMKVTGSGLPAPFRFVASFLF